MKKLLIFLPLLSLIGLLVGCEPTVVVSKPIALSVETPTVTVLTTVTATPPPPPTTPKTVYDGTFVYPSSIDQVYKPGTLINTWTSVDKDKIVGHQVGDPLSIVVHNGESVPVEFDFKVVIPPTPNNWSERHKLDYPSAPVDMLNWVKLGVTKAVLSPSSTIHVPFSINIPQVAQLSGLMEFRIEVVTTSPNPKAGQSIETGAEVRIFLNSKSEFDGKMAKINN